MGGRSTHTNNVGQRVAGMTIQTSLLGQPLPMGWGRGRLSCNLIDYVAFTAVAHTTETTTSTGGGGGGKGGGGGSTTETDTTYTYSASILLGVCEGPITGINAVWKDSSYFSGSGALSSAGLSVAAGATSQAPWAYLTSLYPDHALNYRTIAYAYAQDYDLGSSGIVPNHAFEIDFSIQYSPGSGIYDALPKDILTDFLNSASHGVPSWPSAVNGNWTDWGTYCQAAGIFLSPVLDQTITASEFVRRLFDETNSDCAFSEGLLKIKPLADDPITGNGATWTPNLAPYYFITEHDLLSEVQLEIVDQSDAYNYVQVEFLDRANQYQTAVTIAYDLDDIVTYGRRVQTPQQFHEICDAQTARNVAQLWLQRNLYIRDKYHFDLPADFDLIECNDYIALTTTVDGIQLAGQIARVVQIDEDEEGADVLHFVAEKVPGHTASHTVNPPHTGSGGSIDRNAAPGSVATPFIWNAPQSLTTNGYEVWAAVAGVNAAWGGAVVWASFDNVNYTAVGRVNGPARYGVLSATLASNADPDTTDTLSVNLSISKGLLTSVTHVEADNGATLCWVDGELIDFGTATLTGSNQYNLTYLRRGQQGSAAASHSSGTHFARLDRAIFKYAYLPQHAGQTVYLKFQSFNVHHRALQDLSTCTAYSLTLTPTGSLAGLRLAAGGSTWTGSSLDIICDQVAGASSYRFDIYQSNGTTLVRSITNGSPSCSYTSSMAAVDGAQRTYKIAVTPISAGGAGATSAQITATNAAPAALSSPSATGGATTASINATASSDADLGGYVVFYSSTSGFNAATTGGVVAMGSLPITIYGLAAGTYYCRIAAFDPWSSNPTLLNLSTQMSFAISTGGGGTPSGGGDTGGGYGGSCVAEDTSVLMANATGDGPREEKPIGSCRVGERVWTQHEVTLEWGAYRIAAIEIVPAEVFVADGYPRATAAHRFFIDGAWVEMKSIGAPDGISRVVKMTVEDAHTYVSAGVLSHNIKQPF